MTDLCAAYTEAYAIARARCMWPLDDREVVEQAAHAADMYARAVDHLPNDIERRAICLDRLRRIG